MRLVLARHYIENLREEIKKGMREKAEQGMYPGRAPFGYRNNKAERTIEVYTENAAIVKRVFELYASGQHSFSAPEKRYSHRNWQDVCEIPHAYGAYESLLHRELHMGEQNISRHTRCVHWRRCLRTCANCAAQPQQAQIRETGDCISRIANLRK